MVEQFKQLLYFPLAWYFRFFAAIRLHRWDPHIVVVTGSNGKTTLLHLLESQIGEKAKYSHHANSAYGVSFDILDLHRKSFRYLEWINLFLKAPFKVFIPPPKEKIYVVEADADRPGEGKFLADFLRPEIVLWVSTSRTHSMNFDALVVEGKFASVDEAIAYEFGYFLEYCTKLAIIDGDSKLEVKQHARTKNEVTLVTRESYLEDYAITKDGTKFKIAGEKYEFPYLLPEEVFYSIVMCKEAVEFLDLSFDNSFTKLLLPPGRGSLFPGIKDTILIDSSYNANFGSMDAMLRMFANFPTKKKWVVLSDMLELGKEEKEEHEKLAEIIEKSKFGKIILFGPRTRKYTLEQLRTLTDVISFLTLKEVKEYIHNNVKGEESILFKGSQSMMLEAVIEALLENKNDVVNLPRRGAFWEDKRKRANL